MREHKGNGENEHIHARTAVQGELTVPALEVNDDPAQILDVLTLSEQEKEHSGAEIDVACFVYEPSTFSLGTSVLDEWLAETAESPTSTPKECHS